MAERFDVACAECTAPMKLRQSRFGPFYGCTRYPECDGTHGAHPDGSPLGVPADRATRDARVAAHVAFDAFARELGMTRREQYGWLARAMDLSRRDAHIGRFSADQCSLLIRVVDEHRSSRAARRGCKQHGLSPL